jgi:hypothetical protein
MCKFKFEASLALCPSTEHNSISAASQRPTSPPVQRDSGGHPPGSEVNGGRGTIQTEANLELKP